MHSLIKLGTCLSTFGAIEIWVRTSVRNNKKYNTKSDLTVKVKVDCRSAGVGGPVGVESLLHTRDMKLRAEPR